VCGIFGVVQKGQRPVDACLVRAAAASLGHRGPDASGYFVERGVGLAHTRLALIDLTASGNQPLWDPEGRACLVYNGEVYNFREMRADLESLGVTFTSGTDTEVILQAILVNGIDATVKRLRGMFAFAFYDRRDGSLVLARDRFGIKPIAIYEDDEVLLFASEVKAFAPFVQLRPDNLRVMAYVAGHGGPMRGDSLYAGVRFMTPGTLIECVTASGKSCSRPFHHLSDDLELATEDETTFDDKRVVDLVDRQMQQAVERMLVADAPVGGLCSGGVDSSLIVALAKRTHPHLAIFHANVVGPHSELEAAKTLADHLGLELHTADVHDADFLELLPDVMAHYEQPFCYHPNSVPFLKVSRLVREAGVKAVVCGEGADECFLGYQWLAGPPFDSTGVRHLRNVVSRLINRSRIGRRLFRQAPEADLLVGVLSGFERESEETALTEAHLERCPGSCSDDAKTLHLLGYHLRTLLHRNDRLGMAASIEARFPFLDEAVVATAIRLPRRFKIRTGPNWKERSHVLVQTKWVLRRVADRHLPREVSRRPKVGFPVSAHARLVVDPRFFEGSFAADYLRLARTDVARVLADADRGWTLRLLMLDAWGRLALESESRSAYRSRLFRWVSIRPPG
jgi:asparagine synthase (glutamine-hydrolysing)